MGIFSGGGGSGTGTITKVYRNKPAANISRAATTVGAFSTAWQITNVGVLAGQNVLLHVCGAHNMTTNTNDRLLALLRGSTQIAAWNISNSGVMPNGPFVVSWIDENPGAGTYTYEVQGAAFTSGTLSIFQQNPTTDTTGGSAIFTAMVYTP